MGGTADGAPCAHGSAPTRRTAEQIHEAIRSIGKQTGIRSATAYGGVKISLQIRKLRARCRHCCCLSGQLLEQYQSARSNTSRMEVLVLQDGRPHVRHGISA